MSSRQKKSEESRWRIRTATRSDAAAYVTYMNAIGGESDYLTFGRDEYDRSVSDMVATIDKMSSHDNELFIVAVEGGQVIGALMLEAGQRPRVRHAVELSVTVRKEFWGRGVGSALIAYALDWVKRVRTITKVNLQVREDHEHAIRLYERKGFISEGTPSRALLVEGRYYSILQMGLGVDV